MNIVSLLIAGLLCITGSMVPALAIANQDLEVTMEVIDNISQLDGVVAEMPGPDLAELDEERDEQPRGERPTSRQDGSPDPFEYDDMDDAAHERALQSEGDFEEGEDVDDEAFEIEEEDIEAEEDDHSET